MTTSINAYIPEESIRRTIISRKNSIIRIPMRVQPTLDASNRLWLLKPSPAEKTAWPEQIKPVYPIPGDILDKHAPFHVGDILFLPEPYRKSYLYVDQYSAGQICSDEIYEGVRYETDNITYYPNDPRPLDPEFYLYQEMSVNKPHVKSAESMPVEFARHFIRVTNVRIERVQRIDFDDMCFDVLGLTPHEWNNAMVNGIAPSHIYAEHWNDFMNSPYIAKQFGESAAEKYNWTNNPWVWCIEVEQIEREKITHETTT